ncbi:MAG: Outer membrane lipoprotein Omp16 precursor [Syntrophus sp. PtaB.Bin075]|nr:MAG: Outer membrane lipoprotein Omp16 precursor [Syntrophus sp. PtaB.Bin075]
MRMRLRELVMFACVLCLAFVFTTGCAKKQVLQEGEAAVEKAAGAEVKPATEPGLTPEELAAREKALKEQALKEQQERERLAGEKAAAEKAAAEAAARAGEVLVDINFEFDQSSLTPESREILQKHAAWLAAHSSYSLVIEGHCDDLGTTEYNLALGERRAAEAMRFLVALGIDRSRIKTISYGEEMPLDPAETEEARAKNRRAHFVVTPK